MSKKAKYISFAAVVLMALVAVFAWRMFGPAPTGTDMSLNRMTDKGVYRVAIAPEKEQFDRNTIHGWIVTVSTADGKPVAGAEFKTHGGMPRHGHGLPTEPQMTKDFGDGRYLVEGVKFHMFGWWEFGFTIKAPPGEDRITFNLSL